MKLNLSVLQRRSITYAVIIVSVWLISPYSAATTIFVVLQDGNVWIAADSLESGNKGDGRFVCKIHTEKRFYWAAGSPMSRDEETGFSLQKMVTEVSSTDGDTVDVMKALIERAKVEASKELATLKQKHPADFSAMLRPDQTTLVAKIVLVGKGSGKTPQVVIATIVARQTKKGIIVSGTPDKPPPAPTYVELSDYLTAQNFYLAHVSWPLLPIDPSPLMRDSILAEERAYPKYIGGKVSILEVSPGGSTWKEKGECQ